MVETSEILKRFWSKVDIRSEEECWQWKGWCDEEGYGRFKMNGKGERASRAIVKLMGQIIPKGEWVLHKCDNPTCVNPKHLYVGTPSQNSMDRENRKRGRPLIGSNNGYNKLDENKVTEIKSLLNCGFNNTEIGLMYNVTRSTISYISSGKIWKHVK